jgi:CBS domain-containing protein
MVTEGDLFRSPVVRDWWRVQGEPDPTIEQFMTPRPVAMRSEDDLADIAAAMLDAGIRSIPIVDDGELVGIVSRRDVLRAVVRREPIFPDAKVPRSGGADAR